MDKKLVLLTIALLAALGTPIFGAPIIWGSPTIISGDSDVSTNGTLVAAFNLNGADVTVNAVTFAGLTYPFMATTVTSGNFTFTESPSHLLAESGFGSGSAPFNTLSANYQTLLSTAMSTDDNNTITLTMSGLAIGQQYEFQWWLNDANSPSSGFLTTATATSSVSLDDNTTDANGGVGQFVIGTFTANATAQTIAFNGTNSTQAPTIDALQLRAIPEPSTMSILLLGGVAISGACLLRRKKVISGR
jgi:hypothetical protein